jgi:hypothetical protein
MAQCSPCYQMMQKSSLTLPTSAHRRVQAQLVPLPSFRGLLTKLGLGLACLEGLTNLDIQSGDGQHAIYGGSTWLGGRLLSAEFVFRCEDPARGRIGFLPENKV